MTTTTCLDSVPSRDASRLVSRGVQLVDVRERYEFATGSLPDAVNIPQSELNSGYREFDQNGGVAVYCQTGIRSAEVARFLVGKGMCNVTDLVGGIVAA